MPWAPPAFTPRASGLGAALRPRVGPGSGAAPSWGPAGTGLGGQSPGGGRGPSPRRTRALLPALMAPKRVPASPPPRCPKLPFPSFSPFQTPSPILSGFVGFLHPASLDSRPPRRRGRPGPFHLRATFEGVPAPRGFAGPPVTRPLPPQTQFSALRPGPLRTRLLLAPRNPPDFPFPFYLFLFGETTKRVAAPCVQSERARTERGAVRKEPRPCPRPLPAPQLRFLGRIFGPWTTGLQARGRVWVRDTGRGPGARDPCRRDAGPGSLLQRNLLQTSASGRRPGHGQPGLRAGVDRAEGFPGRPSGSPPLLEAMGGPGPRVRVPR